MKKVLVFTIALFVTFMCNACFAGRVQLNDAYGAEKFVETVNLSYQYSGRYDRFVNLKNEGVNSEGLGVFKATLKSGSDVYGTLTIWANPDGYMYQWRLSSNGKAFSDSNVNVAALIMARPSAMNTQLGSEDVSSMVEEAYQRGESKRYSKKNRRYYRLWTTTNNQGGITYIMEAYDEM